jgi:uncharacterized alpha/beta hydrolase family protein
MPRKAIIELPEGFDFEDETNNLLLNMFSGLLPEDLSKEEISLLKERFGINWFEFLGYSEPEYKRPGGNQ